jgi:predicted nucleic acid-binding protein
MATKTEAYVDTSALIALCDRADSHHATFRRLFADPPALVTTALVIAEGQAWFLRRFDASRALHFLAMIESMKFLRIVPVGRREQNAGIAMLRKFPDQRMTLVDAVGLHVMQARNNGVCWSTDRHLGLMGVPLVVQGGRTLHDRPVKRRRASAR